MVCDMSPPTDTVRNEHVTVFDLWLRAVLAHDFDDAAYEAVPDELIRLLPQDEDALTG